MTSSMAPSALSPSILPNPEVPVYALGHATRDAAGAAGFVLADGCAETGEELARVVLAQVGEGSVCVYPTTHKRRPGLERVLAEGGVVVYPWIVYESVVRTDVEVQCRQVMGEEDKVVHVFFSPRGVDAVMSALYDEEQDEDEEGGEEGRRRRVVGVVAIGPTTGTYIENHPNRLQLIADDRDVVCASHPTPESVARAVFSTLDLVHLGID